MWPTTDCRHFLVGRNLESFEKLTTALRKADSGRIITGRHPLSGKHGAPGGAHQSKARAPDLQRKPPGQNPSPIRDGTSFNDVLPAANFVFQFPGEQEVRLGAAKEGGHALAWSVAVF